jgi:MYXO-CTERM domain-containing protein
LNLSTGLLNYFYSDWSNVLHDSGGTISASATPLPPTWTLMLVGLAGFGGLLYRRKRHDAFADAVPA